jgi:hypothetical protein
MITQLPIIQQGRVDLTPPNTCPQRDVMVQLQGNVDLFQAAVRERYEG